MRPGALATGLLALGVLTVGCANSNPAQRSARAANLRPRFMGQAAAGRPDTCPEGAVDPFGDGTPAPDDARCSYRDPGGAVVRVSGHVRTAPQGANAGDPIPGAAVVVLAIDKRTGVAREVASTHADTQGAFSVGVMLRRGRYAVGLAGRPATARSFEIGRDGTGPEPFTVLVPRPAAPPS